MGKAVAALRAVLKRGLPTMAQTRRDRIPFETGDERKEPKSIKWENVRAVEEGNS